MSDDPWEKVTETWVSEGLIEASQRQELHTWLIEKAPKPAPAPFMDIALVAVITVGNWLLVGALALAVSLLVGGSDDAPLVAMLVAGGLQFALGAGARVLGSRALAQGFFSAWVPVVLLASTALFDAPWKGAELGILAVVLVPVLIGFAIALWDNMPGLAAASAFGAFIPLSIEVVDLHRPMQELTLVLVLAGTCAVVLAARRWPDRGLTFTAAVPFATVLAMVALFAHKPWIGRTLLSDAGIWESGAVSALYGFLFLIAAAIGRSRLVLISGVGALLFSEVCLLIAIGDFWIGIGILATEGVLLIGAAVVALVVRAQRQAAEARG